MRKRAQLGRFFAFRDWEREKDLESWKAVFGRGPRILRRIAWLPKCNIETENRQARTRLFPLQDFAEVVFKSVAYRLSGHACQFPFLAMSRSGSQTSNT